MNDVYIPIVSDSAKISTHYGFIKSRQYNMVENNNFIVKQNELLDLERCKQSMYYIHTKLVKNLDG